MAKMLFLIHYFNPYDKKKLCLQSLQLHFELISTG